MRISTPSGRRRRTRTRVADRLSIPEEDYVAATGATLSQESNYETGLQPGDLTKMMALPWQADFNECSTQDIDVTYEEWNKIDPANPKDHWMKKEQMVWETLWWPAHRPMQTWELVPDTEVESKLPVLHVGARRSADQCGRPEDDDRVVAAGDSSSATHSSRRLTWISRRQARRRSTSA